jgi:hypothetical protein
MTLQLTGARRDRAISTASAAPGDRGPGSRGQGRIRFLPVITVCLLTAVAAGLCIARLHTVDLEQMTGLGLISALPVTTLLGLGLLNVSFIGALSLRRRYIWVLTIQLAILVFLLHGITTVLESQPRFPVTWTHAGFVEFIDRTGTIAPGLDARWSWAGFFALAAFWVGSGEREVLTPVLTAAPMVSNVLYLAAFAVLLCSLRMSWQARWLAGWLFCMLNWIGQDYFSPQGWTFFLYLLFVGFLIRWFRAPEAPGREFPRFLRPAAGAWRRLWGETSPGELDACASKPTERVVLFAVIVGLFTVSTFSHQLTPFAMGMAAVGLIVARRCTLRGLPVLLGVILVAWISYLTYPYWSGHLEVIFGSIGDVEGTVSSNVVVRTAHSNDEHQLVLYARIATTVSAFLLAGWGLWRRRRRHIEDRVLLVLMVAPFGLALLQSYGGEIALRVYMFALAPVCALAALAFFPRPTARPSILARLAAGICTLVVLFSFIVTRYGNEQFERIDDGAVAAVDAIYERVDDTGKFFFVSGPPIRGDTPFMPLNYRDVEKVSYDNAEAPIDPSNVTPLLDAVREEGPGTYLITTRSQEKYLAFGEGYPVDWGERFRRALAAAEGVQVVLDNGEAVVYTLDPAPPELEEPDLPPATGVDVGKTPWTPIGVVFLVMLLAVLGMREALRARLGTEAGRRLRPLTVAAVPLLIGFVAVVVERFAWVML